jgi:Predicted membrane protein (DUF2238)
MGAQRLLLGDWGRVVRDPLDVLRLVFLAGAAVAAFAGSTEDAVRLGGTFLIVLFARWLALPRLFDLGVIVGMALQAFGNVLGLFDSFRYYDVVVHFANPLAVAPCVYILLARLELVPELADTTGRHQLGVFIVTFCVGLSIGAGYEVYEWVADNWLGASLNVGYTDTIGDLADDAVASALGGWFLVLWAQRGWGTTRRVPAERVPWGRGTAASS